jgi:hypothetical protein
VFYLFSETKEEMGLWIKNINDYVKEKIEINYIFDSFSNKYILKKGEIVKKETVLVVKSYKDRDHIFRSKIIFYSRG